MITAPLLLGLIMRTEALPLGHVNLFLGSHGDYL